MNLRLFSLLFCLLPVCLSAQETASDPVMQERAAQRINLLDKQGMIPPSFKKAVHDLIDTQTATEKAKAETAVISDKSPALERQATDAQAKLATLQKQWDDLQSAEETAFSQVQNKLKDPLATPEEQLALLQSFIWSYPRSAHLPEAEQGVTLTQQKALLETEEEKKAQAQRIADREKLLARVATKNLSLDEWQRFLDSMSQFELLNYLGHPDEQGADYWLFKGTWTIDPTTNLKSGLRVQFNGGRVQSVSALLPPP